MSDKVRILDATDTITADVYTIVDGPDRKGNFTIVNDNTQRKSYIHPTRILRINDGIAAYRRETDMAVKCPECNREIKIEIAQATCECEEHGRFIINWGAIDAGVRPAVDEPEKTVATKPAKKSKSANKPQRRTKTPIAIDFDRMKSVGIIYTKPGVEFDYPGFEVKAHVFVIEDGEYSRKLCFNSYNGTWGKKDKGDELRVFIDEKSVAHNGKKFGYFITSTMEQERKKLEKGGYTKED